jgi:hypothetical protein
MPEAGLGKQSFPAAVAKQELRDEEGTRNGPGVGWLTTTRL